MLLFCPGLHTRQFIYLSKRAVLFVGVWNGGVTRQADHAAPVRGSDALPRLPPDSQGQGGGRPRGLRTGLRLSRHYLQPVPLSHHSRLIALHAW
jgi:hypothetical protein